MHIPAGRISEIARYYAVGLLNTVFGYGAFSALIWLGLNLYLAQLLAHAAGVLFNYLMYSRHVFNNSKATKKRFFVSYASNYCFSLLVLAAISPFIESLYVAGLATIILVSVLNYFVLKHFVFNRPVE